MGIRDDTHDMIPAPPDYRQTSHLLHLVLCFCTLGFWWPVWLAVTLTNNSHNEKLRQWYQQCQAIAAEEHWRRQAQLAAWQAHQLRLAVQYVPQQPTRRALPR
jgi:hypothetical protein